MIAEKKRGIGKSVLTLSMVVTFVLIGVMPAMYAEAATDYWTDNGMDMWSTNSGNVGIGTSSPASKLDVRGSATFNDDGDDHDFRIEGTAWSDLFFVDASTNSIGIGTNTPAKELEIKSFSPEIAMRAYSTTGLSGFYFYEQAALKSVFQHRSSGASQGNWFVFGGYANDVNVGLLAGGGMSYPSDYCLIVESDKDVIINEGGNDADFRVESTGNSNMLFVDASADCVGIGLTNPDEELDVNGDVEVTGNYKYATAKTCYLNIPACAFKRSKTDEDDEIWDFGFLYIPSGSGVLDVDLIAPVNTLPDGATVTNFSVYYMDIDSSNDLAIAHAKLREYDFIIGSYVEMADISPISTSGTPAFDCSYDNSIVSGIINNENKAYVILINDYEQDATGTDLRFYGCRIEYTIDTIAP